MSTANIWYVVRERVIFEQLLMNMFKDMNSDQQHMVTVVEQHYIYVMQLMVCSVINSKTLRYISRDMCEQLKV